MSGSKTEQMLTVIKQYFQLLGERNLDGIMVLISDNIDWYVPGNTELAPWLGKRSSKKEIKEFFELLWPATLPISAAIEHIMTEGDFAVVTGEFSTEMLATNNIVNSPFSIHLTIKDGLITKYTLLEDSFLVSEALR